MHFAKVAAPLVVSLVVALTPTACFALGGFPGGFGGGGGGGGGGGPSGAPLPALGATLIGQGVVLVGGYLIYRRRKSRKDKHG